MQEKKTEMKEIFNLTQTCKIIMVILCKIQNVHRIFHLWVEILVIFPHGHTLQRND